jgi:hypothetical protein
LFVKWLIVTLVIKIGKAQAYIDSPEVKVHFYLIQIFPILLKFKSCSDQIEIIVLQILQ